MSINVALPGLDCGLCGFRKCSEFASRLADEPGLLERCIHVSEPKTTATGGARARVALPTTRPAAPLSWQDSLGREFDFYLEHFPEEPGPRECILPHNPLITREMNVQAGDLLIGRPLGMSCGCPITHCGVAMDVDPRTGIINWCVTGPLRAPGGLQGPGLLRRRGL